MKIEVATLREVHADFRRIQYSVRISSGIRLPEASGIVFFVLRIWQNGQRISVLELSSFQKSLKWLSLLVPVSSQACASECADFISFGFGPYFGKDMKWLLTFLSIAANCRSMLKPSTTSAERFDPVSVAKAPRGPVANDGVFQGGL